MTIQPIVALFAGTMISVIRPIRMKSIVLAGLLAICCGGMTSNLESRAWAQPTDGAGSDPESSIAASQKKANDEVRRPRRLIPEGTFVISREVLLRPAGAGASVWIAEFRTVPGQAKLPAMFLMPSRRLQRLENAQRIKGTVEPMAALVSGQVFSYSGFNFLMLTAMPKPIAEAEIDTNNQSTQTENDTKAPNDDDEADEPSVSSDVEAMIEELESGGSVAPVLQRTGGGNGNGNAKTLMERSSNDSNDSAADAARSVGEELSEGSFLYDRMVRLVRSPVNGAWSIAFESDSNGLDDPSLIVLPCMILDELERQAVRLGDAFRFKISGQIYVYGQSYYILPTMIEVPYERDNLSP